MTRKRRVLICCFVAVLVLAGIFGGFFVGKRQSEENARTYYVQQLESVCQSLSDYESSSDMTDFREAAARYESAVRFVLLCRENSGAYRGRDELMKVWSLMDTDPEYAAAHAADLREAIERVLEEPDSAGMYVYLLEFYNTWNHRND